MLVSQLKSHLLAVIQLDILCILFIHMFFLKDINYLWVIVDFHEMIRTIPHEFLILTYLITP